MKITGFDTRIVVVPRERGPIAEGPDSESATLVALRLRTDEGIEGIGYTGFAPHLMRVACKAALDALAGEAIGEDPMMAEAIGARLLWLGGYGAPAGLVTRAVAAIDVALWDIKGKALGQPVYKLLGGARDRVPTYASGHLWRTYDLGALSDSAHRIVERGFGALKVRMGAERGPADEVARLRAVREAVGEDIDIMVDVNQGWNVHQAIVVGRSLEEYSPFWLEDPTHHQDLAGHARIAEALDTPIAAGEYHHGIEPFRAMLERRSVDFVMVDLMRVGGLTQWMKVAHMAQAFNLPVVSHLATEILAHAVAAAPNGLTVEHMPWAYPLFKEVPAMEDGQLVLPQRPGLGLELDEDAIARFQVE